MNGLLDRISLDTILDKFNMNALDAKFYICVGLIVVIVLAVAIRNMMRLGVRMLMGILAIVFVVFATPKINTFLVNKLGHYGIIEQKLAEIVDGDIETKVKYDYKLATGQEVTDEGLLEQLKAEAYKVDPNMSDDLNILMNCGLPSGVTNTILLNIADTGTAAITAPTFAEYVAKFFVVRITWLISVLIAFSVATKVFT
ncbi:hypothetical protein SAMN02910369_00694 [Lachnospiraceae bacterium NE2001]|nr:hypothetical protein SAMN02910369_00694 [Lachnospiraceae bacterium NE2001]